MKGKSRSFLNRRIYRLAIVAAFLIAGFGAAPLGAYAVGDDVVDAAFVSGQTAVVADGPLNLRSGAGTGYSIIETLATGDYVEIQSGPTSAGGYQWYLVYVDATGSTGYVAGVFLGPVSGGSFSIGDTVYVADGPLNVRSGPGTGYAVIDTIAYGTNGLVVDGPVFANGYTWYELDYVGGTSDGWVAGDYLALVSTGGGFAIGDIVVVDSATLNVRSGPGTGYAVIDQLTYGNQGVVLDGPVSADGYTWYQLNYSFGGYTGWVAGEYLSYVSSGGFAIGDTVYVTAAGLNVRSGPGTGYAVIDTIVYGTNGLVVDGPVVANGYTWYELDYVGGISDGWVAGDYLALT